MQDHQEVHDVLDVYFTSIFQGDVARLGTTFHPRAILSGEVKGQPYYKTVDEYLEVVKNRKSPQDLGETFGMKVLSVEILGPIAFAKAHCPMLGYNYIDFLSLVRLDGRWVIAAKIFTHVG